MRCFDSECKNNFFFYANSTSEVFFFFISPKKLISGFDGHLKKKKKIFSSSKTDVCIKNIRNKYIYNIVNTFIIKKSLKATFRYENLTCACVRNKIFDRNNRHLFFCPTALLFCQITLLIFLFFIFLNTFCCLFPRFTDSHG